MRNGGGGEPEAVICGTGGCDTRRVSAPNCHLHETHSKAFLPTVQGTPPGAPRRLRSDRARRPVHRERGHRPAGSPGAGRDVVVAQAAGRQHPPGRDLPLRDGLGLRLLRRLSDRLRAVPAEHRRRAAAAVRHADRLRLHPLPAVRHRRDPQVLQLLPGHADARSRWTLSAAPGSCSTRWPSRATTRRR